MRCVRLGDIDSSDGVSMELSTKGRKWQCAGMKSTILTNEMLSGKIINSVRCIDSKSNTCISNSVRNNCENEFQEREIVGLCHVSRHLQLASFTDTTLDDINIDGIKLLTLGDRRFIVN